MSNPIDKLFTEKLAAHSMSPPTRVWARVEANLSKKNKGLIVFRWAAALLIPTLLTGSILWISLHHEDKGYLSKRETKKNNVVKEKTLPGKNDGVGETASDKIQRANSNDDIAATANTVPDVSDKNQEPRPTPEPIAVENTVATTSPEPHTEITVIPENDQAHTLLTEKENIQMTAVTAKPIVLEYTLESIETSAPVNTEKSITITMELKDKKRMQKVIDFARDAKNSEGPFATIRHAKQDLFAFNFKKDKPKNK